MDRFHKSGTQPTISPPPSLKPTAKVVKKLYIAKTRPYNHNATRRHATRRIYRKRPCAHTDKHAAKWPQNEYIAQHKRAGELSKMAKFKKNS